MNLRELVSRRGLYRLQMALFALRRYVPGPLRQLLKPLYRRYWQRSARRRLAAALSQAAAERPAAGYAIVCLAGIDWELRFQRPQQLLSRLAAAGHPVYYLRLDFCAGQHAEPLEPLAVNVFGLRLPGPARLNIYQGLPSPEQVATWLAELETLAQEQALAEVVCLAHAPFWTPLALAAREKLGWRLVYDCLDEHAGFASNAAPVVAAEARLLAGADLVLATAQSLYEKCLPVARRCVRLPNAADVAHFARPPAEHPLEDLPRPIIGYYGALSEWFNASLLDVAAAAHPEWTFVLIGLNANADLRALERRPNVLLLGERPYVDLPAYLHAFDVAVIPFHVNALTRATNPVKFYEYLAAGKPVVAVELPELAPFRGLFYPATTPADFTLQLEAAVAERDPQRTAARVAAAQANTWDERTAQLKSEIQQLYGRAVIVIVSYQNLDYLRLCLDSVWAKTEYPHYSVVVVDNASGPDVTAYLREAQTREPRLQVVFNQTNIGFAGANNLGLQAAGAFEYAVLLNNDTVVTRGWLSRLIHHLQSDTQLGMVGPVTNWASNAARITPDYADLSGLEPFSRRRAASRRGQRQTTRTLDMFCVGLPRRVWEAIGPLDEAYGLGMFEDDDYALRLRRAGYHLAIAQDVYLHHWGWASFGKLPQAEYDRLFEANRRRFEAKWGERWERPALNLNLTDAPASPEPGR